MQWKREHTDSTGAQCPAVSLYVYLAVLIASLFALYALVVAVDLLYEPNVNIIIEQAGMLVTEKTFRNISPEPAERNKYFASVFVMPFFVLTALLFVRNKCRTIWVKNMSGVVPLWSELVVVALLGVLLYFSLKKSDFIYIKHSILSAHIQFYSFVLFPLSVLCVWYDNYSIVRRINTFLLYLGIILLSVILFFMNIFNSDTISPYAYHFNPFVYPVAQMVNGKGILYNWTGIYGLYPIFLEPIFWFIRLTTVTFSTVMALVVVAVLYIIFLYMKRLVTNRYILLSGVMAIYYFGYLGSKSEITPVDAPLPDPYFQYAPLRMLFPVLLLLLIALYQELNCRKLVYWLTFLISSVAIFWNSESGLVVFASWLMYLGYIEFFSESPVDAAKNTAIHFAKGVATVSVTFAAINAYMYFRFGALPDWSLFSKYQHFFYIFGYYMIKMPGGPHIWNIFAVVYLAGMIVSLNGLLTRSDLKFNSNIFVLTILGIGLFSYYQGRSHDYNIFNILYIPFIAVTVMLNRMLQHIQSRAYFSFSYIFIGLFLLYLLSSAVPSFAYKSDTFMAWCKSGYRTAVSSPDGINSRMVKFISSNSKAGEKVLFLMPDDREGILFAETGTVSAIDAPSFTDFFFISDWENLDNFIDVNRQNKVFAIPSQVQSYMPVLLAKYRIIATDVSTGLTLYVPKN